MKLKFILLLLLVFSTTVFMNEIEDEMKIRAEELFKGTALSKDKV